MSRDDYHCGERAAQARAGVRWQAEQMLRGIRDTVPAPAVAFLAQRRALLLGARDAAGDAWATLLGGPPGFVHADGAQVTVRARPAETDPLAATLAGPTPVGLLALYAAARRRMRINGTSVPTPDGLRITADQVYANCPKHIHRRPDDTVADPGHRTVTVSAVLDEQEAAVVAEADTFYLASVAADASADVSHRGGAPGFVHVVSPTMLRWAEFRGNAMLMTLGNLTETAAAGLLFVDRALGALLQLSGTATVGWLDGPPGRPGEPDWSADAAVEFHVRAVRRTEGHLSVAA